MNKSEAILEDYIKTEIFGICNIVLLKLFVNPQTKTNHQR